MTMNEERLTELLKIREIRPTAMRLLILRTLLASDCALSMSDLENALDTVDKSTIFRTVTLFMRHRLAHCIDDGSGALKYAVCAESCTCAVEDLHTHFSCENCRRTFCMEAIHVPVVTLPAGFTLTSVNYVLKGLCAECAARRPADKQADK